MNKKINALLISIIGGLIVIEISSHFKSNCILYAILVMVLIFFVLNIIAYWRNRIKIEINKQNLTDSPYNISFSAINMGGSRNSLNGNVILQCLTIPFNPAIPCGEKHRHIFYIDGSDNSLEPHKSKSFKAAIKGEIPQLYFSNFRQYKFTPNRGMYTHLYFIGATDKNVSFWKFYFKRFLYRFFKVGLVYKPEENRT